MEEKIKRKEFYNYIDWKKNYICDIYFDSVKRIFHIMDVHDVMAPKEAYNEYYDPYYIPSDLYRMLFNHGNFRFFENYIPKYEAALEYFEYAEETTTKLREFNDFVDSELFNEKIKEAVLNCIIPNEYYDRYQELLLANEKKLDYFIREIKKLVRGVRINANGIRQYDVNRTIYDHFYYEAFWNHFSVILYTNNQVFHDVNLNGRRNFTELDSSEWSANGFEPFIKYMQKKQAHKRKI